MPELPEVEAMRKLAEQHCAGRKILEVMVREAGGGPRDGLFDDKVIGEGMQEKEFIDAICGRTVMSALRRGKHMWLELSGQGPHLLLHFGMTGSLAVDGVKRFVWQSFHVNEEWPPRFTKLQLILGKLVDPATANLKDTVTRLAFVDARRFGHVWLRKAPAEQDPVQGLAPDPLSTLFPTAPFIEGCSQSSLAIKTLLLDQARLVCGIGNWVADEVLFKAGVHPSASAATLSTNQATAIHAAVLSVLRTAVSVDADSTRFPKGWLFHVRWDHGPGGDDVYLPDGSNVKFCTVGGRTTAWVPDRQLFGQRTSTKEDEARPNREVGHKRKRDVGEGKSNQQMKTKESVNKKPASSKSTFTQALHTSGSIDLSA